MKCSVSNISQSSVAATLLKDCKIFNNHVVANLLLIKFSMAKLVNRFTIVKFGGKLGSILFEPPVDFANIYVSSEQPKLDTLRLMP